MAKLWKKNMAGIFLESARLILASTECSLTSS